MNQAPESRETLLIVDDTPANISMVSGILKDTYRLKVATNGEKALSVAASADRPDLILLDISMPEMDGYEVCERLKADPATVDIPVIFLTANTGIEDETRGLALGAVDYIHKPFSPPIVQARVRTHLSLRRAHQLLKRQNDILQEQLQHARKLEAIGHLSSGVAHDFNNIIGAVMGFAEFLVEDLAEGTPQHRYAQRIVTTSHRARDLVSQILAFSRKTKVERTQHDLGLIAREVHDLLRVSLPSSTELVLEAATDALVAEVNTTEVAQVLVNLCVNANDSLNGRPGRVAMRIGRATEAGTDLSSERNGPGSEGVMMVGRLDPAREYARIEVADNGSGMSAQLLRRIFDPFYTTKATGKGTGLGLAMVDGIVESYGGACFVASEPGVGTIFRIYLPLVVGGEASVAPVAEVATAPVGTERLLLVDDDPSLAEMLGVGLIRMGYSVTSMSDPTEALALFETSPTAFDVVVLDQVMPKMTGLMMLERLRAIRAGLPVIFFSRFADDLSEGIAAAVGGNGYFVKPVTPEQVARRIRELAEAAGQR